MHDIELANQTRQLKSPLQVGYCESFLCRLRGLSFRRTIPHHWGLLLVQEKESRIASAIHMLGMNFDLAIVWISNAGEVVDLRHARRWISMIIPRKPAMYTLELAIERLGEFQIGDKISFDEVS
ncbi:MAG: hypothetical protein FVQ83_07340 [Chloroflexi bacterium]|nr:hypothetical protein [Chloroflexota bacterium]